MHSKVMVLQDVWGPVDIMQCQFYCGHDTLPDSCLVVSQGCWEEPSEEDIMLVVSVSIWMNF